MQLSGFYQSAESPCLRKTQNIRIRQQQNRGRYILVQTICSGEFVETIHFLAFHSSQSLGRSDWLHAYSRTLTSQDNLSNDKTTSVKTNKMNGNNNTNDPLMGVPYMISGVYGVLPGATTR